MPVTLDCNAGEKVCETEGGKLRALPKRHVRKMSRSKLQAGGEVARRATKSTATVEKSGVIIVYEVDS